MTPAAQEGPLPSSARPHHQWETLRQKICHVSTTYRVRDGMERNAFDSLVQKMEKEHGGAHTAQDSNLAPDRQTVSVGNPGHVAQRRRHHQRGQFPHTSPRHAPAPRPLPSPRSTFFLLLRCYDERESADASTFSAAPVAGAGGGTAARQRARHVATPRFRSHVPVPIGLDGIGRGEWRWRKCFWAEGPALQQSSHGLTRVEV